MCVKGIDFFTLFLKLQFHLSSGYYDEMSYNCKCSYENYIQMCLVICFVLINLFTGLHHI